MKKYVSILMVLLAVFTFFSCEEEEGPLPTSFTLELNPAKWRVKQLPENAQSVNGTNTAWPTAPATPTYDAATKVLTLTYGGKNRQMGLIPLSAKQDEILRQDKSREEGVTFRIDATVTVGDTQGYTDTFVANTHAGFRTHIGDPTVEQTLEAAGNAIWWNATSGSGINQNPLNEHLVEFRTWDHAFDTLDPDKMDEGVKPWSIFKFFIIQAMFKNASNSNDNDQSVTFPEVKIAIKSITIELGDTRTAAEMGE